MENRTFTAFHGVERIETGAPEAVVRAVKATLDAGASQTVLIFDDTNGRQVDFDFHGTPDEVVEKLDRHPLLQAPQKRGRGRPKLGVVSREVSLLPRHWDWLGSQPGGMSATLRRLIDEARKSSATDDERRRARDAANGFMWIMAGNLPNFEEATRALYRGDEEELAKRMADWPKDVREHVEKLLTTTTS